MPTWILNLIIQVVIQTGLPPLINLLLGSAKVPEPIKDILRKLLEGLNNPSVPNPVAKSQARAAIKEHYRNGIGSPPAPVA